MTTPKDARGGARTRIDPNADFRTTLRLLKKTHGNLANLGRLSNKQINNLQRVISNTPNFSDRDRSALKQLLDTTNPKGHGPLATKNLHYLSKVAKGYDPHSISTAKLGSGVLNPNYKPTKLKGGLNNGNPFTNLIKDNTRPKNKQKMGTVGKQKSGAPNILDQLKQGAGKGTVAYGTKGGKIKQQTGRAAPVIKSGPGKGNTTASRAYNPVNPGSLGNQSLKLQASKMVNAEVNKQVREIIQQMQQQKAAQQYDINKTNALYDRTKGDLNYVFGEAKDFIGAQGHKIDQTFGGTKNDLISNYANAQAAAQQRVGANRDAALAEQQRLGIQQSGLGNFNADAANAQNVAAQVQQNNLANLAAMQSNSDSMGNMLQSMSQASLASAVGRATNSRADSISNTQQQYRDYFNSALNDINNARADRGNQANQLYLQMQNNAASQAADQAQMRFQQAMAANQFNLDVNQFNTDTILKKAALRQQAKKANQAYKMEMAKQTAALGSALNGVFNIGNILGSGGSK